MALLSCVARQLNSSVRVRGLVMLVVIAALAACRGENPPRDYQNAPPAMTHPPQSKAESPAEKGLPQPLPETSTGGEGKTAVDTPITPPATGTGTTTIKDQPPATKTHT